MLEKFPSLLRPHLHPLSIKVQQHLVVILGEIGAEMSVAPFILSDSVDGGKTQGDFLKFPFALEDKLFTELK